MTFTPQDPLLARECLPHGGTARIVTRGPIRLGTATVTKAPLGAGDPMMLREFVKPFGRATAGAVILFTLGCGGGGGGGGGGPTSPPPTGGGTTGGSTSSEITVQNNQFTPATTTVAPGSTVTWTWNSCTGDGYGGQLCTDHSVVFDDGVHAGSGLKNGGSFSQSFASAGTYSYHCSVHGTATSGMRGTITVQ